MLRVSPTLFPPSLDSYAGAKRGLRGGRGFIFIAVSALSRFFSTASPRSEFLLAAATVVALTRFYREVAYGVGTGENRKIPVIYVKEGDQRMARLVYVCVCVCPFIAGALLVWGGGEGSIRRRESRRQTSADRRTDGRTYVQTGAFYTEGDVHPEYSRVLLLAHKLRLFSFPILPL